LRFTSADVNGFIARGNEGMPRSAPALLPRKAETAVAAGS